MIYEARLSVMSVMLGKRPDMTTAVDWDVKHQFKQTKTEKMLSL